MVTQPEKISMAEKDIENARNILFQFGMDCRLKKGMEPDELIWCIQGLAESGRISIAFTQEEIFDIYTRVIEQTQSEKILAKKFEIYKAPWFSINPKNGNVSVIPGLLAEHMKNNTHMIDINDDFFQYEKGVYKKTPKKKIGVLIKNELTAETTRYAVINEVRDLWSMDIAIDQSKVNKEKNIINFKNGLFNVDTWKFGQHTPDYLTTIQLGANYNPNAKCPTFMKYIEEACAGVEENIPAIQEMMGYLMIPNDSAQTAFVLHGDGGTGKGTLLRVIKNLLRQENISGVTLQQMAKEKFTIQDLYGKLANLVGDLPANSLEDTGNFKMLTGQDEVRAEYKNINGAVYFQNTARIIFSCNKLPSNPSDNSNGFYRRLMIFTFENKPKVKDPDLNNKLEKELDGIVMWALEGLKRLIKNKFQFSVTDAMEKEKQTYKIKNDNVLYFADKCLDIIDDDTRVISEQDLYDKFQEFCKQSGCSFIQKKINFTETLSRIPGITFKTRKSIYVNGVRKQIDAFIGIKLKED